MRFENLLVVLAACQLTYGLQLQTSEQWDLVCDAEDKSYCYWQAPVPELSQYEVALLTFDQKWDLILSWAFLPLVGVWTAHNTVLLNYEGRTESERLRVLMYWLASLVTWFVAFLSCSFEDKDLYKTGLDAIPYYESLIVTFLMGFSIALVVALGKDPTRHTNIW